LGGLLCWHQFLRNRTLAESDRREDRDRGHPLGQDGEEEAALWRSWDTVYRNLPTVGTFFVIFF
jgi:hypothetical protein